jgi:hypothetical protein
VAYQLPSLPKQALGLDSPIRDVIADEEAWAVVLPAILRRVPHFTSVDGNEDASVRQVFAFQANGAQLRADIEAALAGLQR